MRVTIWDLDYYYQKGASPKNLTAMKISSWHKQKGDTVLLVTSAFDIDRAYDICYMIRENLKTPTNFPARFLVDNKVRWIGKAFLGKHNWTPPQGLAGCRPDYLLYPELDTREERAEFVSLFNPLGEFWPHLQNWTNSFKNKLTVVQDKNIWKTSKKLLLQAFKMLQESKNIVFSEPISIQNLISDKEIREEFFKLKLAPSKTYPIKWTIVGIDEIGEALVFLKEFKERYKNLGYGQLTLDWHDVNKNHWEGKELAQSNFADVRKIIIIAKEEQVPIKIMMPQNRLSDTPYFFLFEELANWTKTATSFRASWLEYITKKFLKVVGDDAMMAWNNPMQWNEPFRSLLIQSWFDSEFLLRQWGMKSVSQTAIPWDLWKEQFRYGI